MHLTRREAIAFLASMSLSGRAGKLLSKRREKPLRVGYVSSLGLSEVVTRDARDGVMLGVSEAARTSTMMGSPLRLVEAPGGVVKDPSRLLATLHADVAIGCLTDDECERMSIAAASRGVLLFNIAASADRLRGERCSRGCFHVAASVTMERRAREASPASADAEVLLWDGSLERYGAAQLNDRFRHAVGRSMTGAAWAGWFAVKVVEESRLRARSGDPATLRDYLERPASGFDGHKGELLTFRSWDHQLRQPLYVVTSAGTAANVMEVPSDSALAGNARGALERLAGDSAESACHWTAAP